MPFHPEIHRIEDMLWASWPSHSEAREYQHVAAWRISLDVMADPATPQRPRNPSSQAEASVTASIRRESADRAIEDVLAALKAGGHLPAIRRSGPKVRSLDPSELPWVSPITLWLDQGGAWLYVHPKHPPPRATPDELRVQQQHARLIEREQLTSWCNDTKWRELTDALPRGWFESFRLRCITDEPTAQLYWDKDWPEHASYPYVREWIDFDVGDATLHNHETREARNARLVHLFRIIGVRFTIEEGKYVRVWGYSRRGQTPDFEQYPMHAP